MDSGKAAAGQPQQRSTRQWSALCCLLLATLVGGVQAQSVAASAPADGRKVCSVSQVKSDWRKAVKDGMVTALSQQFSSSHCGSLRAVMSRLADSTVVGGRKLEGVKPFDQRAAELELATAGKSLEYQGALQAELAGESDPARRLLIEAATLHEFGHFLARDLILQRLQAGGGT